MSPIAGSHGTAKAPKPVFERAQDLLVQPQWFFAELCNHPLGNVVAGRAEAAGRDHESGAIERFRNGGANRLGAVANRAVTNDFDAGRGQCPSQLRGIGIRGESQQQLGADGDDLELHLPTLRSVR